jgi:hypothetical protein
MSKWGALESKQRTGFEPFHTAGTAPAGFLIGCKPSRVPGSIRPLDVGTLA